MTDPNLEIKMVAQTIFGEARGEGPDGMAAVADVIANRVADARIFRQEHGRPHPLFGDGTFANCCRRPSQFSCWNPGNPNLPAMTHATISDPIFLDAMQIASKAVTGNLLDSTNGATYYYAVGSPIPSWAQGKEPCATIGHQLFFNNIN